MRELPENKLHANVVKTWKLTGMLSSAILALFGIVPVLIIVIVVKISPLWLLIPVAVVVLLWLITVTWVPRFRYARYRYQVHDAYIDILEGIIFVKRTVIPLVRVQYTDSSQGPFLRAYKLAQVDINTAGGSITIPGLSLEDADLLRDKIAELAAIAKEEL
ncbi:MAG: PH domain-containing protein [Clostridiales Family XIII bacterium]|jgi:membrane protein YdbS with pleckstrin-like domain|nr:PH domain-containing protein [Clostridiales Family XIII bacterium]